MQQRFKAKFGAALAIALVASFLPASASWGATREPMPKGLRTASLSTLPANAASGPTAASEAEAETGEGYREYPAGAGYAVAGSSSSYGEAEVQSVVDVLGSLLHGPELDRLSVYVATPEEIAGICGESVIACYQPETEKMIVSGADHAAGGVPRDFAIAHEYGHHIANSQEGAIFPAMDVGTARWATYERVCQLTRARKLFPGDQGNHYFEDPEEAFAEAYAHLADPKAKVSWQYAPFLRPTAESMKKIRKDIVKPWRGPVASSLGGTLAEPGASSAQRGAKAGPVEVGGAVAVGTQSWVERRSIGTPLDGEVSVSLQAPSGASFAVALRNIESGRVVSRAVTGDGGSAEVSFSNCGASAVELEVRSLHGSGDFTATVDKP